MEFVSLRNPLHLLCLYLTMLFFCYKFIRCGVVLNFFIRIKIVSHMMQPTCQLESNLKYDLGTPHINNASLLVEAEYKQCLDCF